MKKIYLIVLFSIQFIEVFGQFNCFDSTKFEANQQKVHNVIGLVPSNARVTNGWGIGWSTSLDYCAYLDSVRINGLYTNISPFQPLVAAMVITMAPFALLRKETYKNAPKDTRSYDTLHVKHKINGVSIGLFEIGEEFTMQGVQITGLYHQMDKLNGASITLVASDYKHFNGLMISGVYNKAYKGRGVQIGLVNRSIKMNGIQIGLWNIIGDRGLPFINMSFKKKD